MNVLYPKSSYNEVCYIGTALYIMKNDLGLYFIDRNPRVDWSGISRSDIQ